ncbi:protein DETOXIFICATION 16-like [Hibiscus syriacus]|uniref:protein DETOXIFICATION 16-like n=1 Tax=Hibiscus syriacus TaxID=106335 RepID=UPI0019223A8E|nr:protein DETOXIFICATION 16-like [Hibiscus syriacus]
MEYGENSKDKGVKREEIIKEVKKQLQLSAPLIGEACCSLSSASLATSFATVLGFNLLHWTLCGQSYEAKQYRMLGTHTQQAMVVLSLITVPLAIVLPNAYSILVALGQDPEISRAAGAVGLGNTGAALAGSISYWITAPSAVMLGIMVIPNTGVPVGSSSESGVGNFCDYNLELKIQKPRLAVRVALVLAVAQAFGGIGTDADEQCFGIRLWFSSSNLGIARRCGWQKIGAYVNLGSYYIVGIPLSIVLAFVFHLGTKGLCLGIRAALFTQMMFLLIITARTNWEQEVKNHQFSHCCNFITVALLFSTNLQASFVEFFRLKKLCKGFSES